MNPNRKFKNDGPDGWWLIFIAGILCFITMTIIVLDPIHKQNIKKKYGMNTKKDYWNEFGGAEKAANIFSAELAIRIRLGQLVNETEVDRWLNTPNNAFNNKKPIDMIIEQDLEPLYRMLYILESGEPLL